LKFAGVLPFFGEKPVEISRIFIAEIISNFFYGFIGIK
jgi:hypothetical protein